MKTRSKIISALAAMLVTGSLMAEQQPTRFIDRLVLDFSGKALISQTVPTGIGGSPGVGLAFRDFNLFINPTIMIAEPLGARKFILIPTLRMELKFTLSSNFLTLLPYVDVGGINTTVVRPDGTTSGQTFALYGEAGSGIDIQMTHELSLVARAGIAYGMVTSSGTITLPNGTSSPSTDSNNHSGPTISLGVRYTFGRPQTLDY